MNIDPGWARTGVKVLLGSLALAASAGVALAQSYSFTTCGQDGTTGPSQGACDSAYAATTLAGAVTVTAGIQAWTVPQTGRYVIQASGAQGGTQTFSPGFPGGLGATMRGEFDLVAGQTIRVLVGHRGGNTGEDSGSEGDIDNAAPGGGGGSFVYFNANDASPLIAAGGGAGGSRCTSGSASARNANAGTSGNSAGNLSNAGANGNGGLRNTADDSSYWAGGGSGWLTDGTGGNNSTNNDFNPGDSGAEGGRAPRNGGEGGIRWIDDLDEGGNGGFGGGGGGGSDNMGTGGGGGYSGGGGGGGGGCGNEPGGGGGSFNDGFNQVNIGGTNEGDGSVTITFGAARTVVQEVPTLSQWALILMALMLAATGFVAVRRS